MKIRSMTSSVNRRIPFKYCSRDIDRHGNERIYIRLPNMPKYRMKSAYLDDKGSITQAFTEEYTALYLESEVKRRLLFPF